MNGDRLADAARGALDWIASVAVEAGHGRAWSEDGTTLDHLYSGTAGVLLGCAELTAAGVDATAVAAGARDRLLHIGQRPKTPPASTVTARSTAGREWRSP
jgi:hypothetical protein